MKIFLDDERPAPEGWVACRWPSEVITLIEQGSVEVVSLDHDLGDDERGTGYDVCTWLEKKIWDEGWDGDFVPPIFQIHSANPVGRERMAMSIRWSFHHFKVMSATRPERWDKFLSLAGKYPCSPL